METMLDFLHKLVYLSTLTLVIGKLNVPETTVTDVVSFDFTIGGEDVGTIDIGLFGETVPLTVENFIQFSSRGPGLGYEGSKIHRVIENFMIQGGDFVKGDGSGEASIYGGRFADENFKLHHYGAGWVSMANAGADTNTCQFFITAKNTYWLDEKHVVFGKVLRGMWVLKQIMKVDTDDKDEPQVDIVISKTSHEKLNETFTVAKEGADWDT